MCARLVIDVHSLRLSLPNKRVKTKCSRQLLELLIFLHKRQFEDADGEGWTTLSELRRLKRYQSSSESSLKKIISRYIHFFRKKGIYIIEHRSGITTGPYRLNATLDGVKLSISPEVAFSNLELVEPLSVTAAPMMLRRMHSLVSLVATADKAFYDGRLSDSTARSDNSALSVLEGALNEFDSLPVRMLLNLRRFEVLERLGDYQDAQKITQDVLDSIDDQDISNLEVYPLFKCQALILKAWIYYRRGAYSAAKNCLHRIKWESWNCRDDLSFADYCVLRGLICREEALAGIKKSGNDALDTLAVLSLTFLQRALYYYLRAGYYEGIQNTCFNIANTLYRFGNESIETHTFKYGHDVDEIKEWLALSDSICETFSVGGNSMLNKIVLSSVLLRREGNCVEAEKTTHFARKKLEKINNLYELGLVHRQLTAFSLLRQDKHEAKKHREIAHNLFIQIGAQRDIERLFKRFPDSYFE